MARDTGEAVTAELKVPGLHNVANAFATLGVAKIAARLPFFVLEKIIPCLFNLRIRSRSHTGPHNVW